MAEHSRKDLPTKRHAAAHGSARSPRQTSQSTDAKNRDVVDADAVADNQEQSDDFRAPIRTNLPRVAHSTAVRSAAIVNAAPDDVASDGSAEQGDSAGEAADEMATGEFPAVSSQAVSSSAERQKPLPHAAADHPRRAKIATNVMVLLLCALLGFGYVTQQRSIQTSYSSLSESELVRLLDETNQEVSQLESRKAKLEQQLQSIQSAADKQAEAQKVAKENEETAGILAGRIAAKGPGVIISIAPGNKRIDAATMFNLIEELRNAGAEVMEVNGVRIVTSSYFTDTASGVNCDGTAIHAPYTVSAIGDANALENAVNIAGGVGSRLRVQYGATVSIERKDSIVISKLAAQRSYKYATPVK